MDIIVSNISKKYGDKQVLKDYSVKIKEGGVTVIMGASGEGKTTFLRILAGLETADSGFIKGMENKTVSMVFQEDRLCGTLNAIENMRLVCKKNILTEQIYEELENIGLKGSETQPVMELSGGMRRRVALLRALIVPYDILILDEPFNGLDEDNKKTIMDYTKKRSIGKTVIMVTHDEKESQFMGGDIVTINNP